MKQIFTILLYPFAILYDLGSRFRNHLYNISYKRSFRFDTNVIGVGNLSVGGTGKTPVVEYLLRLLSKHKIATLSRGYGRKTKGFRIADQKDSAITLGDEPFQFYKKFPKVIVSVGEERAMAIPRILYHQQDIEVIVLDDAYQHRSVIPGLNILLTEFDHPFFKDYILPAGRLREARKNAHRADVVVVTKCPEQIKPFEKQYLEQINRYTKTSAPVFFSKVTYQLPKAVFGKVQKNFKKAFVFTGIANERALTAYLKQEYEVIGEQHFADHYRYQAKDIERVINQYDAVKSDDSVLVTTEKDMVKLLNDEFKSLFAERAVYYIPIEVTMIEDGAVFDEMILSAAKTKTTLP